MSFKALDKTDNNISEGRSCLILCNFTGKELQTVKNYALMLGLKDHIYASYKDGESKIEDLLENKTTDADSEGYKDRAILFNNIPSAKLSSFIDNLKKMRVTGVLFATVTETSKTWTLNVLISNLLAERNALKKGMAPEHH